MAQRWYKQVTSEPLIDYVPCPDVILEVAVLDYVRVTEFVGDAKRSRPKQEYMDPLEGVKLARSRYEDPLELVLMGASGDVREIIPDPPGETCGEFGGRTQDTPPVGKIPRAPMLPFHGLPLFHESPASGVSGPSRSKPIYVRRSPPSPEPLPRPPA